MIYLKYIVLILKSPLELDLKKEKTQTITIIAINNNFVEQLKKIHPSKDVPKNKNKHYSGKMSEKRNRKHTSNQ